MRSSESPPPRLAIFVPTLRGGGAERVMVMLANELSRMGLRIDLVLASHEGVLLNEISPKVGLVDLETHRVFSSILPLAKYLRSVRPRVVLSVLPHANIAIIVASILSGTRPRIVVSERAAPRSAYRGARGTLLKWIARSLYSRADAVIAVSEGVASEVVDVLHVDGRKVQTILNPVDIPAIDRLGRDIVSHPWLNDRRWRTILAVGRLAPVKGFETLISAFSRVRVSHPCKLIILGEGPLRDELISHSKKLGVRDDVDFPGFQENPYSWMTKCDLFVLSSLSEGLPNSLIQAMACGMPVISTDARYGPAEILEGGKWGRLVPVGDTEMLAEAMREALDDIAAPQVQLRARDFSLVSIVGQYREVLKI